MSQLKSFTVIQKTYNICRHKCKCCLLPGTKCFPVDKCPKIIQYINLPEQICWSTMFYDKNLNFKNCCYRRSSKSILPQILTTIVHNFYFKVSKYSKLFISRKKILDLLFLGKEPSNHTLLEPEKNNICDLKQFH